jgi:hypothetical protein
MSSELKVATMRMQSDEFIKDSAESSDLERKRKGTPGKQLLRFAGVIEPDDIQAIIETVETGCERDEECDSENFF